MSFHSAAAPAEMRASAPTVRRLLGAAVGFLVWAIHFLVVYVATAVACVLRPEDARAGLGTTAQAVLVGITVAAVVLVATHAARAYHRRELPGEAFRTAVTMGCDAIAAAAIAWQLFAILLVPPCV
jgi:hypothetical protein